MERPWGSPDPATAQVRSAVRDCLAECAPGDLVLVACSGGSDSRALAHALAVEAPALAVRCGAVVVDHGLREGSGPEAERVAGVLTADGLDPVDVVAVIADDAPARSVDVEATCVG